MTEPRVLSAAAAGTITIGALEVHRLGFGAMRITGDGMWGPPQDPEAARSVLRRAVELGVTFIDTADSYGPGTSEELIAEALHPYPPDLVVATKGGFERPGPGRWVPNGRPAHLKEAAEASLRRLRLDRLPLYQLHCPDPTVPFAESLGALAELQAEGKIRHIGVSNVTLAQLDEALAMLPVASVQNRYNLADRSSDGVLDRCEEHDIVFVPWAPIQDLDEVPDVGEIASRHGVSDQQVALAWLLARSPVVLPIPGTASVAHLEANIEAAGITLDADDLFELDGRAVPG
jgi:pyridoxine 4-dehydrogenase